MRALLFRGKFLRKKLLSALTLRIPTQKKIELHLNEHTLLTHFYDKSMISKNTDLNKQTKNGTKWRAVAFFPFFGLFGWIYII